jgi:hypothetical protein
MSFSGESTTAWPTPGWQCLGAGHYVSYHLRATKDSQEVVIWKESLVKKCRPNPLGFQGN